MKIKYVALISLIGFMGGCAHKTDAYDFETIQTSKLDESKIILTTFPTHSKEIEDSLVGVINSYKTLSVYNTRTGENIRNFSSEKINFDSLMKCTYQKKYRNSRTYRYNKSYDGLADEAGQIKDFQYTDGIFYILVNSMAEVSHFGDDAALEESNETEEMQALKKKYGKKNVKIMDYLRFIIVTDDNFQIKQVIPLYESKMIKEQNYYPIFERAFFIENNDIYTYLTKYDEAYETMRSKKQIQDQYVARINLYDEEDAEYHVNSKEMSFANFSINDYFGAPFGFSLDGKNLLYSNSKEICDVETGKKIFAREKLLPNESIESYHRDDNGRIIMVTYLTDPLKRPTELEVQYAIDSTHSQRIKLFDEKTQLWSAVGNIPPTAHGPYLVGPTKIVYFEKDKENYLLKYIPYNEN